MKKSLFLFSLVSALAFKTDAAAVGANVIGLLRVDSTNAETFVAVPWLGAGTGDIKVADLIKTTNLTVGDELYAYIGGSFNKWTLSAEKEWSPSSVVSQDGPASMSAGASEQALSRGKGVLLVRHAPIADSFYIFGQVATGATAATEVAAGSANAPAYTMIAPPVVADVADLNDIMAYSSAPDAADRILVASPRGGGLAIEYKYVNGKWGKDVQNPTQPWLKAFTPGLKIPAGQGAWYVSKGGSPIITWSALPAVN